MPIRLLPDRQTTEAVWLTIPWTQALASVLCSSVLSIWMCREGLLLGHRLGPALAPLRRPPRTLDARIARLAQCKPSPAPS